MFKLLKTVVVDLVIAVLVSYAVKSIVIENIDHKLGGKSTVISAEAICAKSTDYFVDASTAITQAHDIMCAMPSAVQIDIKHIFTNLTADITRAIVIDDSNDKTSPCLSEDVEIQLGDGPVTKINATEFNDIVCHNYELQSYIALGMFSLVRHTADEEWLDSFFCINGHNSILENQSYNRTNDHPIL